MNIHIINELRDIQEKIKFNSAKYTDYQRFEELLIQAGYPASSIHQILTSTGFTSWDDFLIKRNQFKDIEDRERISKIIGWSAGIIGGLFILWLINKDK